MLVVVLHGNWKILEETLVLMIIEIYKQMYVKNMVLLLFCIYGQRFFSQVKMNTQKINTPLFIREKNWKKERKKNARTNWKLFSIKGRNIHKMTLQKSFTFSDLLCNLFILGKISSSITLLIKLQTPSMCWIEFNSISTLA